MKVCTKNFSNKICKNKYLNNNDNDNNNKKIISIGKNIEYYYYDFKSKTFDDKIKTKGKEIKEDDNNKEKMHAKKRKQKKIFDKKINKNKGMNLSYINIYFIISMLILIFLPISYMKASIRKLNSLVSEISMIIYGKTNLRFLYNKNNNPPSELLID